MATLKYQPNHTIFKEGDDANSFYIITEGSVKINIINK
jgi:CRP-like cAMP-binding protein